jgi:hypothetical protein
MASGLGKGKKNWISRTIVGGVGVVMDFMGSHVWLGENEIGAVKTKKVEEEEPNTHS